MKSSLFCLFLISILPSIWGILVYEFDCEAIAINSYTCLKGWPEFVKSISYGVVSGWIIYFLTVFVPYYHDKEKCQLYITSQLESLNEEVSYFLEECIKEFKLNKENLDYIEYSGNQKFQLISANSYPFFSYMIPWKASFKNVNLSYVEQAEIIIHKICKTISTITLGHRNYLTDNQLRCFATIDSYVLAENWINKNSNIEKIDIVERLLGEIMYPLQKSINISNDNIKIKRDYQSRL